jgi:DNA (cytosine-5)-methyltransferase 1
MAAYYNEIDPKAAAWLRELIKNGHIADGIVDERSIIDVTPDELRDFTQCHFFAGVGVWSYALRSAGWADDRPVWTGSCPCQPFSAAGARGGFDDERHLWPHWHHLISQCRPPVVFGEQVASKDGLGWLDLVCADMEATGYAIGAADLCASGIGAPHIRQRLWFVGLADTSGEHLRRGLGEGNGSPSATEGEARQWQRSGDDDCAGSAIGGLADTDHPGSQGHGKSRRLNVPQGWADEKRFGSTGGFDVGLGDTPGRGQWSGVADNGQSGGDKGADRAASVISGLADTAGQRLEEQKLQRGHGAVKLQERLLPDNGAVSCAGQPNPGPTNGFWRDADWLFCRDGKWRPVEPSTSPLAHGAAARVGRLRGYGNAVDAIATKAFIEAFDEAAYPEHHID